MVHEVLLPISMVLASALYTIVGHAGASAYLALMALFGITPCALFRLLRKHLFRDRVPPGAGIPG
jgi:hypothetical protein